MNRRPSCELGAEKGIPTGAGKSVVLGRLGKEELKFNQYHGLYGRAI